MYAEAKVILEFSLITVSSVFFMVLTIKVLAGAALVIGALWGLSLWTSTN